MANPALEARAADAHRIEPINGSTFRITYNQWAEVEIGDAARDIFRPHAKIKRWGDECWLKVELPTVETKAPLVEDGKIKWVGLDREVHFYPLAPADGMEEGGFEFEVILKQKPATNKVVLEIETQGLDFFYQPPYNLQDSPEDIGVVTKTETQGLDKDGNVLGSMPENAVGSYAVYHKTRGSIHKTRGDILLCQATDDLVPLRGQNRADAHLGPVEHTRVTFLQPFHLPKVRKEMLRPGSWP